VTRPSRQRRVLTQRLDADPHHSSRLNPSQRGGARWAAWLTAVALSGCGDAVLDTVRVCGDLIVPDELSAVRVTVLTEDNGVLVERSGGVVVLEDKSRADVAGGVDVAEFSDGSDLDVTIDSDIGPSDMPDVPDITDVPDVPDVPGGPPRASARQLPIEVGVGALTETRIVRAQALARKSGSPDESEVLRVDVLVSGRPGGPIIVNLERACLGRVCPLGQTCAGGACTVTPTSQAACLRAEAP